MWCDGSVLSSCCMLGKGATGKEGGEWALLAAVFARVTCQCVFHALWQYSMSILQILWENIAFVIIFSVRENYKRWIQCYYVKVSQAILWMRKDSKTCTIIIISAPAIEPRISSSENRISNEYYLSLPRASFRPSTNGNLEPFVWEHLFRFPLVWTDHWCQIKHMSF